MIIHKQTQNHELNPKGVACTHPANNQGENANVASIS